VLLGAAPLGNGLASFGWDLLESNRSWFILSDRPVPDRFTASFATALTYDVAVRIVPAVSAPPVDLRARTATPSLLLEPGSRIGLCWPLERRRVAPHSGTTGAGREPHPASAFCLSPGHESPTGRVHQPFFKAFPAVRWRASPVSRRSTGRARGPGQRCQTTRSSCTRSLSRFGSRWTKWRPRRTKSHPRRRDPAPGPRAPIAIFRSSLRSRPRR
jgi:hypothetical protein